MNYKIVRSDSEYNLEDLVNKDLEDGWIPQGGVSIKYNRSADHFISKVEEYYQALIKS